MAANSAMARFDHRFGKLRWRFLGQIVPDASLENAMRIFAREFSRIPTRIRMRRAIGVPFKGDAGNSDERAPSQTHLQRFIVRFPRGQPQPPAIIMDHDVYMIRIVECLGAACEGFVVEIPLRRGLLPDEPREFPPILLVAGATPLSRKIILIPPLVFRARRNRLPIGLLTAD